MTAALWLTLAVLPLDDLVQHQHGQMVRYWQRQTPVKRPVPMWTIERGRAEHRLLATAAEVRVEEWRTLWGRALVFLPTKGRPVRGLIAVPPENLSREEHAGVVQGMTPAPWLTSALAAGRVVCVPQVVERLADHPMSIKLRGKDRRRILERLAYPVGYTWPWLLMQQSAACELAPAETTYVVPPVPLRAGPAVAIPYRATRAALRQMRDEHFALVLGNVRRKIEASGGVRRERWNLLATPPAEASAMLRVGLRELIGERDEARLPLKPELRKLGETEQFTAFEVLVPVLHDLDAYGHLLLPKRSKAKRPAVIVQHGLGGQPKDLTGMGPVPDRAYHLLGARLAEQGYVVFAPYVTHPTPQAELINPLAEAARRVGRMRISVELTKLRQIVDFLQSRPEVDAQRIGYYGLSYGGYSAIWMGALEPRLAAIVVSGHFNDWRAKITDEENPTSYLFHPDEDFYTLDVLHRFTHVELIAAMWPRPVCVEFAERDATTTPAWHERAWREVAAIAEAWQAPVTRDHFDGVHEIHGMGTLDFLKRWLRPDERAGRDGNELISQRLAEPVRGSFYGSGAFRGLAFRLARRGDAGALVVRYGANPGGADLGTARLNGMVDGWVAAPVALTPLTPGRLYWFELSGEEASGSYELFGPRPLGGRRWDGDFGVSFRFLER